MDASSVLKRFQEKCGTRVVCAVLDATPWAKKELALHDLGFIDLEHLRWTEVNGTEAVNLLAAALAENMCYGVRVMADSTARELSEQFVSLFHEPLRFFTNSSVPFHRRRSGWVFHSITPATMNTGVVVKSGAKLAGILWVSDND